MSLQRFEPFGLIKDLHRDLDRFAARRATTANTDWLPAVDIVEEKERFVLRLDLPGVANDDIDVQTENGLLSVTGQRHREKSEHVDGVRRYERRTGKFARHFTLPEKVDADRITAQNANGILEVVIPKQPAAETTRRIDVQAA